MNIHKKIAVAIFIALFLLQLFIQIMPNAVLINIKSVAYNRQGIMYGEIWRLFMGQLVHLNATHFIINICVLFLIRQYCFYGKANGDKIFLVALVWCLFATNIIAFFVFPTANNYVGMSGFLHGMYLIANINVIQKHKLLGLVAMLALIAKIAYEFVYGAVDNMGFNVAIQSHHAGILAGIIFCVLWGCWHKIKDWA